MPEEGQRSEQPTPRRLQQAREEGQIASSRDLTQAVQFGLAVGLLGWFAVPLWEGLRRCFRGLLWQAFRGELRTGGMVALILELAGGPLLQVVYLGAALLAASLLMHLLQTGFAITPKRLRLDFSRLEPTARIRELPGQNLRETVKALLLFPLFLWACWVVIREHLGSFMRLPALPVEAATLLVFTSVQSLLWKGALVLLVLGAWDYWRTHRRLHLRLRMSKQEVRQEQRELEGNPLVKARLRRLQRDMMRRRMMSRVPKASVVITNPTHYAVALEYHLESMRAPVVTAKGRNYLARRIVETAQRHAVPIVENAPLAQALYKSCQLGSEIPVALYRAVAEILAYIFRLTKQG